MIRHRRHQTNGESVGCSAAGSNEAPAVCHNPNAGVKIAQDSRMDAAFVLLSHANASSLERALILCLDIGALELLRKSSMITPLIAENHLRPLCQTAAAGPLQSRNPFPCPSGKFEPFESRLSDFSLSEHLTSTSKRVRLGRVHLREGEAHEIPTSSFTVSCVRCMELYRSGEG